MILILYNSFYSELCQSTCFEKNENKICEKRESITGTVPYIIHNSQRHAHIHTSIYIYKNMHLITIAYTYHNLYTLAELSFHKNWLSESPPCVFDLLYKEKCKKKSKQKVTVNKFWNMSKTFFLWCCQDDVECK